MNENYEFFWNGEFSQWYPCKFKDDTGKIFVTAEQFMMHHKALTFGDAEIAELILKTNNPKDQKALGRQVKNFDADKWNSVAKDIVYQGNQYKFTQNPVLLDVLLSTGNKTIVEASPYDRIWGIGLGEEQARITPPEQWLGTNWLGEVLTKLRDDLKSA
jgi:ribA/ribD-fused uncharacterized protein